MLFWCFFFFPPLLIFFFSLFLFYSLFFLFPFCSLDAAKRKAWKLNRVGSLRNIYSSSSTNTEGNKTTRFRWTPPLYPFFNPLFWKLSSFRLSLPNAGMEIKFAQSMRAFILCLQSHSSGLFIFLFVHFILPFMFLSAYLNFDLSL